MRPYAFVLLGAVLVLGAGCSNDSGTSGPEAMAVELSVRAMEPFHGVSGATVLVENLKGITNSEGLAVFHTDINVLAPNHSYRIIVNAGNLIQAFPESDTVIVPSAPNMPSGYILEKTVQMKPLQEAQ